MVSLVLHPTTKSGKTSYADIIKVSSAYTRSNTQSLLSTSEILYVNKNESRVENWLNANRLQLPLRNQNISAHDYFTTNAEKSQGKFRRQAREIAEYEKPITQKDIEVLRSIGKKSVNDFTSVDIQKAQKWAYKFYKELGTKSPFFRAWFGDWRAYDDNSDTDAVIVKYGYAEYLPVNSNGRTIKNNDTGFKIMVDGDVIGDSLHYASIYGDKKQVSQVLGRIDEIVKNAVLLDTQISVNDKNNKKSSTSFMHYFYAPITVNNAPFLVKLTVEEYGVDSNMRGYNIRRIKMSTLQAAQFSELKRKPGQTGSSAMDSISVSQLYSLVKQFDKDFHAGKPVNPALLNEDGTPRVFYHGTSSKNGEFYIFDETKAVKKGGLGLRAYGKGNYFTTIPFTGKERYGDRVIEAYLSIKNPLYIDGVQFEDAVKDALGYDVSEMSSDEIQKALIKAGFDGVIAEQNHGNKLAVTFTSGQIKSATDNIGTFDRANPDIRRQAREIETAYDKMGESARLAAENEKLRDDIDELNRLVSLLKWDGEAKEGKFATKASVSAVASELLDAAGVPHVKNKSELMTLLLSEGHSFANTTTEDLQFFQNGV